MVGTHTSNGYQEILPGVNIKAINCGMNMIMVEFQMQQGASLPDHSHSNEQSGYCISGCIRLIIAGEAHEMKPGDSWNIPGGTIHKAEVLEDSVLIEVFSPVREDYVKYLWKEDILE
jgi:quercetin dioxygenase-like cupin family protein